MARRKDARKPDTAVSRSTAAIFQNIDDPSKFDKEEPQPVEPVEHFEEQDDSPDDYKFPLNLIFELQDFLNARLDFCRGVELLVALYLGQVFYLYMTERDDMAGLSAAGFSVLGGVLAMYLSHRSLRKKYEADPENILYPELPDFNTLYAFMIPILLTVLLGGTKLAFFQLNLAINNFCIHSLHTVAKIVSAFAFYYMYNENETVQVIEFVQVVWIYFTVEWALTYWNEQTEEKDDDTVQVHRTLTGTEIHLICVLVVNLLANFHLELSELTIPLFIVRQLLVAFAAASGTVFPFVYGISFIANTLVKNLASLVVSVVFCGVFYYVTNYLFNMQVYDVEVVSWLYNYILLSELRVHLLGAWLLALVVSVPTIFVLSVYNKISLNVRRKSWHFLLFASLAYPALILEPVFTSIAVFGSVFVFIVVEMVRASRFSFVGELLDNQLKYFQDEKDTKGPLSLSYIFLLVGVAIPIAYGVVVDDVVSIRSYIGLVTLGLSDSSASIVGRNFGKIKWKGGHRTLEGTITYIVVTFASFVLIDNYLLPEESRVAKWENTFIVAILSGAIEGAATLNDNILVPSVSLIAYELLNGVF